MEIWDQIKVNAMAETKAPLGRDAYISPRVHDRAVENIYRHDYAAYYAKQYGTSVLAEYFGASQKIAGTGTSAPVSGTISSRGTASLEPPTNSIF